MGQEGSRLEYPPGYEDDEIFGPGFLQAPPRAKPGVQRTTSTLVDIHNALGSDMAAIRKLRPQESTDSDPESEQLCDLISLDEFTVAISSARSDKHLKEILNQKYNIPAQFLFIGIHDALKHNKLDMLAQVLRMNAVLPSDSLLKIDDEFLLMHLHKAMTMNQMDTFRLLLQSIKDPRHHQSMTELQAIAILAAQFGNMAVVQLLCINYPFCMRQTKQGTSVFIEMARAKPTDDAPTIATVYNDILEADSVYVNTQEPDGNTALHVLAEREEFEAIKVLLLHGGCVNLANLSGKTALDIAKENWADQTVIHLMEEAASTRLPVECSLYHAAVDNEFSAVQALLDNGIPIDSKWIHGKTALSIAAEVGNTDMVRFLLEQGASPIPLGCYWPDVPAMVAMLAGHFQVALLLTQSTEDYLLNASNPEKKHIKMQLVSLLFHCCRVGATKVAKMVLNSRANINPNTEFRRHRAPIHVAAKYGQLPMIRLLIGYKARVELGTEIFANSALHYACFYGHLNIARFLLELMEVDINCTNIQHETPLFCVLKGQLTPSVKNISVREDSVIFLIRSGASLLKPGRKNCELKKLNLQVAEQRWNFVPEQTIKLLLVLRDEDKMLSLASAARLVIRGAMTTQPSEETVCQLGLPFRLQEFILLKDWFST